MEQKENRQIVKSANRTLAVTLFIYITYSFVLLFLRNVLGEWLPFLDSVAFQLVSAQLFLLVPTVFFMVRNKLSPVEFLRFRKIKLLTVFLVVVFTYVSYPVLIFCNYISLLFSKSVIDHTIESLLSSFSLGVCVLIVAFVPCLVEECIFRGVLFQAYRKGGIIKALLITAVLFGLFHMNLNQMSYAIVMGMIFVCLNEATGSILSSVLMHFLINGTSVVMSGIMYKMNGQMPDASVTFDWKVLIAYGIAAGISLVILYALLHAIAAIEGGNPVPKCFQSDKTEEKTKIGSVVLYVVFVICVIMMILMEIGLHI